MNSDIVNKVGNDPRLIVIQSYLTKGSKKGQGHMEIKYLKEKGLKYFLSQVNANMDSGLTTDQAEKNAEKWGTNLYKKKKTKSFFQLLLEALNNQILIILIIAAILDIVIQYFFSDEPQTFWLEGVSILCAVAVVSLVESVNNYQKQKQFEELNAIEESTNKFKALRNKDIVQLQKGDLVVGDILLIDGGAQVPADGIVIKQQQAVVDEGAITGQSIEKYKCSIQEAKQDGDQQTPSPVLISGTSLGSGSIRMLILVVGKQSVAGKLNEALFDDDNEERTPLQIKLQDLVEKIGRIGFASAFIVFFALTIRLVITDLIPHGWSMKFLTALLDYLILAISIIVVAIPEGLPLAVTLSLAYSVKQMLKQKNLVRKLASCETMGGAHVICTDKTGTLTQNEMFAVQIWNGKMYNSQQFAHYIKNNKNKDFILDSLALNTKAALRPKPQGSPTEQALLKFLRDANHQYYDKIQRIKIQKVLHTIPFNSDRKRMSTLIDEGGKKILLQKGGWQIVLAACEKMNIDGNVQPINKQQIERSVELMAKKGLRVIGLAYKQIIDASQILKSSSDANSKAPVEKSGGVLNVQKSGFILHMLVGIQDLPRMETKDAIESCHRAGVVVIMVTGDNKLTARAIADQVGITNPNDNSPNLVRQGKQIENISPEDPHQKIEAYLRNLKVMARSRPEHKYRLVECIKKLNNVVAVTGDGTNDAPALMKADVGFAMGVKGTQIAKGASDIIIMDDKFDSIVRALIWGRNIYESIRKFLQFQLTVNVVACIISVLSSIFIRQSVLAAIQMLWVNMIMDSLASLALATEPPCGDQLLDRRPFQKNQPLITKTMLKHIIGQTIWQLGVLIFLIFMGPTFIPEYADGYDNLIGSDLNAKYYLGQPQGTVTSGMFYNLSGERNYIAYFEKYKIHSRHFTFIFTTFVMMQVFNFFNCRRIRDEHNIFANPCSNWLYWAIVAFIFIAQWVITQYLNIFFKLYKFGGLKIQHWILALLFGALTLFVSQMLRLLPFWKPEDDQETPNKVVEQDLHITYRRQEPIHAKKDIDLIRHSERIAQQSEF